MTRGIKAVVFFVVFLLFSFSFVNADEESARDVLTQEKVIEEGYKTGYRRRLRELVTEKKEELPNIVENSFVIIPSCKARAQDGHITVTDAATAYSYDFKLFEKIPVELGFGTRYIGLNSTVDLILPSSLTSLFFGGEVTLPFFNLEKTYFRVGVFPRINADKYNTNSTAFRVSSHYLAIYQPNEKWTWVLGLGVFPGYEATFVPIGGFIYKPNDRLSFNIVPETPNIAYTVNDKLDIFAEFDYSYHEYKVTKDKQGGVALVFKDSRVGTGFTYHLNKNIDLGLIFGGVFNRTLKYGDSLGKVNIKNGGYVEVDFDIKF